MLNDEALTDVSKTNMSYLYRSKEICDKIKTRKMPQ